MSIKDPVNSCKGAVGRGKNRALVTRQVLRINRREAAQPFGVLSESCLSVAVEHLTQRKVAIAVAHDRRECFGLTKLFTFRGRIGKRVGERDVDIPRGEW